MLMRLTAAILGACLLNAQPPEEIPTIKVEVNVVNVLATVRDSRGALVNSLTQDDFQILEDGSPQDIRYFSRETDLPLTLGLLVDVSASQRNLLQLERRAAEQFLDSVLRNQDLAFIISFGAEVELLQDLTSSRVLLSKGLDQLRLSAPPPAPTGSPVPTVYQPRGTVLFDAVYLAATERLQSEVGRKAIVLITDGVDTGSRKKLEDAIREAQKADAIIYSIYYVDPEAYGGRGWGGFVPSNGDLKRMSEQTGGRLFEVSRRLSLDNIFRQIQEELRSQYSLGYISTNTARDGSYRRIEVRVKKKGYKVQARKGCYAPMGSGD